MPGTRVDDDGEQHLQADEDQAINLARVLNEVRERVRFCEICGNVAEEAQCSICRDPQSPGRAPP